MSDLGEYNDGTPVTEKDVERWAAEAERGYDLENFEAEGRVRRGPGRPPIRNPRIRRLEVRVDEAMYEQILSITDKQRQTKSEYLHQLIKNDLASK